MEVSVLQSNLLNTATKGIEFHITQVSVSQSNLINTDTKGTVSTLYRCLCYSQTSLIQPPKGQSVHITQVSVSQSNLINTDTKGTVSVLQPNLPNTAAKGTVSTLHRCRFYSQTSLIQTPKGLSVHITQVSVLQWTLLNSDTKGIDPECPHYTGVCVSVKPP